MGRTCVTLLTRRPHLVGIPTAATTGGARSTLHRGQSMSMRPIRPTPCGTPSPAGEPLVGLGRASWQLATRLCWDDRAESHLEYALIAGFAGTLLIGAYIRLSDSLDNFFRSLSTLLDGVL